MCRILSIADNRVLYILALQVSKYNVHDRKNRVKMSHFESERVKMSHVRLPKISFKKGAITRSNIGVEQKI